MVVRGRCLPYGEGITFWPLAEMVRQAGGIRETDGPDEVVAKLGRCWRRVTTLVLWPR